MNKKIQSITSAMVILMLVGIAVGYSYTDTGFRAPWFATDDETFNTSTGTVNISAATGVLPNASIPLSAMNRSFIVSGTYVGDGTQNRAFPHNMGVVPRYAHFYRGDNRVFVVQVNSTWQERILDEGGTTVTAWDSTNIYIGGSTGIYTNNDGGTFFYVIIGS